MAARARWRQSRGPTPSAETCRSKQALAQAGRPEPSENLQSMYFISFASPVTRAKACGTAVNKNIRIWRQNHEQFTSEETRSGAVCLAIPGVRRVGRPGARNRK